MQREGGISPKSLFYAAHPNSLHIVIQQTLTKRFRQEKKENKPRKIQKPPRIVLETTKMSPCITEGLSI